MNGKVPAPLSTPLFDGRSHEIRDSLARSLPSRAWLATSIAITAALVVIYLFAGFAQTQSGRDTRNLSIINLFRLPSVYYVLALTIPIGWKCLLRGWPILLAILPALAIVLTLSLPHATSIAFQYGTTLIPILFVAAIAGAAMHGDLGRSYLGSGMAALTSVLVASLYFGALPWSHDTLQTLRHETYPGTLPMHEDRRLSSEGIRELGHAVELLKTSDASVLVTSQVATHLLSVRRLEPVDKAINRWQALEKKAGPERSAIEVFDWIVVDTYETFQQDEKQIGRILDEAQRAGYKMVFNDRGVIVLARPERH